MAIIKPEKQQVKTPQTIEQIIEWIGHLGLSVMPEYVELGELVASLGTNRSAWIREMIQASIAMQKNNSNFAQPPP
jgi:hypothetical protein